MITSEELVRMFEKSPVVHVEKVSCAFLCSGPNSRAVTAQIRAPLMFAVGEADLRVPSHQIKHFERLLRSRGVPTRCLCC